MGILFWGHLVRWAQLWLSQEKELGSGTGRMDPQTRQRSRPSFQ